MKPWISKKWYHSVGRWKPRWLRVTGAVCVLLLRTTFAQQNIVKCSNYSFGPTRSVEIKLQTLYKTRLPSVTESVLSDRGLRSLALRWKFRFLSLSRFCIIMASGLLRQLFLLMPIAHWMMATSMVHATTYYQVGLLFKSTISGTSVSDHLS